MHISLRFLGAAVALALIAGCAKQEGAEPAASAELTTDAQKFGYSVGVDLGKSLSSVKDDVDIAALKMGLDDAIAGRTPALDDKQREEVKSTVSRKLQKKQLDERMAKGKAAEDAGKKFLEENKKREGVKTTASGLQYEVVQEGAGETPKAADKVTVHYKGTLISGEEFDSSYSRGQPITFPLGNVIAGWTEGLQLMKPGAKYKLFIPSELAYGARGAGAKIGPNEALIFEVELVSVEKADAAKKEPAKK